MRIAIGIIVWTLITIWIMCVFAALQEDDIEMLTQEELEQLANELWEREE